MFATAVRYFAKKSKPKLKPVNPKVPREQAETLSRAIFNVVKRHGPLPISNAWERVQEAGVQGVNSKSHLKVLLRWMRERQKLHLLCNHVGNSKQFLWSTWLTKPESAIGYVSKGAPKTKVSSLPGGQQMKST